MTKSVIDKKTNCPKSPDYDTIINADALLRDLAEDAKHYGKKYEYGRKRWRQSLSSPTPFQEARYWMLEATGGRRAYSNTLTKLQSGGRFRKENGTVDVSGLLHWLNNRSKETNKARNGDYTETRQPSGAHSAYRSITSTIRSDYEVGWPRLDGEGNPLKSDLP